MSFPRPNFNFITPSISLNPPSDRENTPPSSPVQTSKCKLSELARTTLSDHSPSSDSDAGLKYATLFKNDSPSSKIKRSRHAIFDSSSDEEGSDDDSFLLSGQSPRGSTSSAKDFNFITRRGPKRLRTEPTQNLPFPKISSTINPNPPEIETALIKGFDQSYEQTTIRSELSNHLATCKKIFTDRQYSKQYPLFIEQRFNYTYALILEKNLICLVGKKIAAGCQSEIKLGVMIRYDELEDRFELDGTHPEVIVAHANSENMVRNRGSVTLRYSADVRNYISQLDEHDNIVPPPLFVHTNPKKVIANPKDRGMALGQVSIEPIRFDGSSDHHKFASVTEIKSRALHIAKGLKHLHDSGLIHRDLKSDNIFIDGTNTRIGDLELLIKENTRDTEIREIPELVHNNVTGSLPRETKSRADERIVFGYLVKKWLSRYLENQPYAISNSKKEENTQADNYTFDDKRDWEKLYDFAHTLTHTLKNQPRSKSDAPMSLDDVIAKLELNQ